MMSQLKGKYVCRAIWTTTTPYLLSTVLHAYMFNISLNTIYGKWKQHIIPMLSLLACVSLFVLVQAPL